MTKEAAIIAPAMNSLLMMNIAEAPRDNNPINIRAVICRMPSNMLNRNFMSEYPEELLPLLRHLDGPCDLGVVLRVEGLHEDSLALVHPPSVR